MCSKSELSKLGNDIIYFWKLQVLALVGTQRFSMWLNSLMRDGASNRACFLVFFQYKFSINFVFLQLSQKASFGHKVLILYTFEIYRRQRLIIDRVCECGLIHSCVTGLQTEHVFQNKFSKFSINFIFLWLSQKVSFRHRILTLYNFEIYRKQRLFIDRIYECGLNHSCVTQIQTEHYFKRYNLFKRLKSDLFL